MKLVLASSSPYRKKILEKIGMPFECISPNLSEGIKASEDPAKLVERLATDKAKKIAQIRHEHLIIGSDQVAVLDEHIITKPINHQNAIEQLILSSGRSVTYLTGLCLMNSHTENVQSTVVPFVVHFRDLTIKQIENYLQKEQPYDCAGSIKSEGMGIALFRKIEGEDPNSLVGLPIIKLLDMLYKEGVDPLR